MDEQHAMADAAPETLDLRGLKCPLPVLHARRALGRLAPGRAIVVRCTDPLASLDIPNLVRETGDVLVDAGRDGRECHFTIRRSPEAGGAETPGRIKCGKPALTADSNSGASKR